MVDSLKNGVVISQIHIVAVVAGGGCRGVVGAAAAAAAASACAVVGIVVCTPGLPPPLGQHTNKGQRP